MSTEVIAPAASERIAVPCGCPGCRKPAAFVCVERGRLVIEISNRHNGERHRTIVRWVGDGQVSVHTEER